MVLHDLKLNVKPGSGLGSVFGPISVQAPFTVGGDSLPVNRLPLRAAHYTQEDKMPNGEIWNVIPLGPKGEVTPTLYNAMNHVQKTLKFSQL
jgi:hypothetical protein